MKTDTNAQKAIGNRTWQDVVDPTKRADVPEGLWMRCPNCEAMSYRKQVQQNLYVCPDCDYHYRIGADQRIEQICDPGSFEAMWTDLAPKDVLNFVDRKPYKDRLIAEQKKTGHLDAVQCGKAFIKGRGVCLAVMDSRFMMASMGSVVGEKITRTVELAIEESPRTERASGSSTPRAAHVCRNLPSRWRRCPKSPLPWPGLTTQAGCTSACSPTRPMAASPRALPCWAT